MGTVIDFNLWGRQDEDERQQSHISAFADAIHAAGLGLQNIIADGKIHRFSVPNDKPRNDNGWYVFHDDARFAAGSFGTWKGEGDTQKWCSRNPETLTESERAEYQRRMAEMALQRKAEEDKITAECKAWVEREWEKAPPAPDDHPYLRRKGIKANGARLYKDSLMIPVGDSGVQFIYPDGEKKFKKGTRFHGACYFIPGAEPFVVCEGFATGASIHEATGLGVAVAFNCGNLMAVAKAAGGKHLIIAADNDHKTAGNPGLTKGREVAEATGARLVWPEGISGTDFNDMAVEQGAAAVSSCFSAAMGNPATRDSRFKPVDDLMDREFKPINWAVEGLLPEGLAVLAGPPKLGKSWLSLDLCLAVATGGLAAGHFPAQKGSVLLCALEDNERRLKSRIEMRRGAGIKFALDGPLDFNVLADPKLPGFFYTIELPRLNVGGMDALRAFVDEHPDCKLIVLDTLAKIKPEARGRGNAYEQDYNDMGELQRFALEKQLCIIVITHNRKTETDDVLQSISGSTGITGVMDTIMILKRARGNGGASLFLTGRDVTEHTWALNFNGEHGAWSVTGDFVDGVNGDVQDEIFAALQSVFKETGRGMTPKQLFEEMGGETLAPKMKSIYNALDKLNRTGAVIKHPGAYRPTEPQ